MRIISKEELNEILKKHQLWLKGDNKGIRADLLGANLRNVDLRNADLRGADLCDANLRNVDLRNADLRGANLCDANLRNADLRNADLRNADLCDANLRGTNLCDANLRGTNLRNADLCDANLRNVDLRNADLRGANLRGTNLRNADLCDADLRGAKNIPFLPRYQICPEEGSFMGFKKVNKKYIVKMEIPEKAKRSSATTRKCRCEFAKVLSITNLDDSDSGLSEVVNKNYVNTTYKIGEIVYPDNFDEDRWNECSHGIHFFITRQEAVDY